MSDPENTDGNPVASPEDGSAPSTDGQAEPTPDAQSEVPPNPTSSDVPADPATTDSQSTDPAATPTPVTDAPPVTEPPVPASTTSLADSSVWTLPPSVVTSPTSWTTVTYGALVTTIPVFPNQTLPTECGYPGVVPVPIQNATSWDQTGCLRGFLCPNNNASFPPMFCPPSPDAQVKRLMTWNLESPQGQYEPLLCQKGNYCPPPYNQSIVCPENHYCPYGSYKPIKCLPGSSCPKGSDRALWFGPLILLLILDAILISVATFFKIRQITKRRALSKAEKSLHKGMSKADEFSEHQPLTADTEYHGVEPGSIAMESRMPMMSGGIGHRRPSGFAQLGAMDSHETLHDHLHGHEPAAGESTDLQLFVQSLKRALGGNTFGLSFEYENLRFQPPKSSKTILDDVSGVINAGSLWGVMGASGAGKSTFVNVLMGKTAHTGGVTKVNGVPGDIKKYKKIIGYVPQDDIVLPELTVRENILHSARIRLPSRWSDKEIQHHVDILISCLQLSHVKDSLVGSPGAPVISGGQRKRVSIGMELAAAPMAVFLDEPTSGLDATAAASIMATLKALTRLGMTIIVIIHQPRQEIFESLDSLVLLGAGRMIYQGPEKKMQSHFENLGFHFPDHNNPADTMGDIIAGQGRLYKKDGDASIFPLIEHWHDTHPAPSPEYKSGLSVSVAAIHSLDSTIKSRGAYFHKQVYFCFLRAMVQQYRLKSSFFFELGVGAMAGFLIGLAYLDRHGHIFQGIYPNPYQVLSSAVDYNGVPQMALLVDLAIGLTASAPGVKIFGEEKLVYWREAAAGHNRFAYYIGKVLSTVPRMVLACFHFSTMFLLLSTPKITWGDAFAANLAYFYCIYGLASCISMVTRREDGPLLAVMASLIVGVLNGGSPSLEKVRSWHLQWLWRASPGTWLAEGYFNQNLQPYKEIYIIDVARQLLGYRLGHFGRDMAFLVAIGTIYRIVAFLGLRFMFPAKQR